MMNAIDYMRFFEEIPEEQWKIGSGLGTTCALGHLNGHSIPNYNHHLAKYLGKDITSQFGRIVGINDGWNDIVADADYFELGDTPKERVMNALLLKAAGVWEELFR